MLPLRRLSHLTAYAMCCLPHAPPTLRHRCGPFWKANCAHVFNVAMYFDCIDPARAPMGGQNKSVPVAGYKQYLARSLWHLDHQISARPHDLPILRAHPLRNHMQDFAPDVTP